MKKCISCVTTGMLILALMSQSLRAADASSTAAAPQKPDPKMIVECIAFGVIGGVIIYSVYRCAKAAGLTNPPKPPTPPSTNSSNAQIIYTPMDSGPTPPGFTNIFTGTNTYTSSLVPGTSIVNFNVFLATNNDAAMEAIQDISTNNWMDWQGNQYTWFLITQTDLSGPHAQTSTNLTTWTDVNYTVEIWLSSSVSPDYSMSHFTNMVTVICDGSGIPLFTNWSSIKPNTTVNVGIPATSPKLFFRGIVP
jgi:hypothetical protein